MSAPAGGNLLAVEEISVRMASPGGTVRALDRVSLTLERGTTLALVGESGSGKSTLCRAILGVLPRSAGVGGRIVFEGRDLAQLSQRELNAVRAREIGVVLQNPMSSLNPVLKVGRQVAEPMLLHLGLSARQARERCIELLGRVGIPRPDERVECYPHQLSGGMCQRVAIAIALACDPKLLIADEPTSALDVTVQAEILNLLGRLQRERQLALLLVSHDLAVVAGRAHRTAVMYGGRIVERALTADLFARMRMHYTRALFDAIPRIDDPAHRELRAIAGHPPDLAAPPAGCPFAPRCPRAEGRCHSEEPPLLCDGDDGHCYACWFPLPERRP
jgi:peptide/nickel transport system ATP-binding protein